MVVLKEFTNWEVETMREERFQSSSRRESGKEAREMEGMRQKDLEAAHGVSLEARS